MGNKGSKGDAPSDSGGQGGAAPSIGQKTGSGYTSDVHHSKPSLVAQLAPHHQRTDGVYMAYDTSSSWELGRGGCGAVTMVTKKSTGEKFAMKTVRLDGMDDIGIAELRREIEIQRSLCHPNVVKLFESFEDKRNKELHIIMEICEGGALVSRMKTHRHGYGEKAAATLIEKMLSSVIYCHSLGVIHRDIKLDNFIFEDEREEAELKLIDFGFACEVRPGEEDMFERLGTLSYMSPELVCQGKDRHKAYDSSVDMWAIGVVAYMLLSGKRPFHHADKASKMKMIERDPLQFPDRDWGHISGEAKDFCQQLMQKDPKHRMNGPAAVKHPWIQHASTLHQTDAAEDLARHGEVVDALSDFTTSSQLQRAALEVIAFQTPPAKLEELRRVFVEMDTDDSGTVTPDEFRQAMSKHPEVPLEQVEKIFRAMDLNKAGEVDYGEFVGAALMSQKQQLSSPSLLSAFHILDRDHDGYITQHDLSEVLGREVSDNSGIQGKVTFEQFKLIMLKPNCGKTQALEAGLRRNMSGRLAGASSP